EPRRSAGTTEPAKRPKRPAGAARSAGAGEWTAESAERTIGPAAEPAETASWAAADEQPARPGPPARRQSAAVAENAGPVEPEHQRHASGGFFAAGRDARRPGRCPPRGRAPQGNRADAFRHAPGAVEHPDRRYGAAGGITAPQVAGF